MINNVVLVGRLCADPEIRYTQSGVSVAEFTIAVDRPFTYGDSKKTDFFRVVSWRNTADFVGKYLKKGRLVGLEGMLTQEHWEKDGEKHSITKVLANQVKALDRSKDSDDASMGGYEPPPQDDAQGEPELPF